MLLFLLSTFHKLTCQETPVCQKALVCQEAPVCLESPVCQDTLCFWNYDLSRHANLSRYSNRLRTLWSVKTLQLVKTKYTVQTICIGIWTFENCIWPFSCWLNAADMQMPKCKIPITYCKILIAYCKLLQTKWPNNISISSQFSYELDSKELHSCSLTLIGCMLSQKQLDQILCSLSFVLRLTKDWMIITILYQ